MLAATDRAHMQDASMILMLHDFVAYQKILKDRKTLSTFIENAKTTFANDKIYLIKMTRILLETLTPKSTDIELLRSKSKVDRENAENKLKDF